MSNWDTVTELRKQINTLKMQMAHCLKENKTLREQSGIKQAKEQQEMRTDISQKSIKSKSIDTQKELAELVDKLKKCEQTLANRPWHPRKRKKDYVQSPAIVKMKRLRALTKPRDSNGRFVKEK